MDRTQQLQADETADGGLLVELLDASLACADEQPADEATGPQLGFTADEFDGWVASHHELNSIHPHHDCEDCGMDDGGVLSDLEVLDGCGYSRSPSPYVAFDDEDVTQWTEEAALGPFMGECMGEWYMDGMAMEWEDEDEGNGFSFGPYYYGGEVGAEQVYSSPLWE